MYSDYPTLLYSRYELKCHTLLSPLNCVHIWQVLPQLSFSETCEIRMWRLDANKVATIRKAVKIRECMVLHDDVIKWQHFPRYWPFVQRPVTRNFGEFFDLHLNKWLSKQSRGWWFETPSPPLWRDRNGLSGPIEVVNIWPRTWEENQ